MMNASITDTNWLINAVIAEIKALGIAESVSEWEGTDYKQAMIDLCRAVKRTVFVGVGRIELSHDVTAGEPISCDYRRSVTVLIGVKKYSKRQGDRTGSQRVIDQLIDCFMWSRLGQDNVIVLPQTAEPVEVVFEDAPSESIWRLDLIVQHPLNPNN